MSKTTDSISTTCVLCCQDAKLFAVGPCDHPICAKCSTRMRVLCEQKYCSVCRNDMETVIFVKKVHPYASIISHKYLYDKKAGIRFSAGWMKSEFEEYLCHKCPVCKDGIKMKTIKQLEEHVRRNHELYFCNLCLENVKVFTSERPLYNRKDLAIHKRKGDPDNTSYRGHPLCEFCDVRFYDNDELLKHLRRQHYYCHFCENDGISNQYYENYEDLRHHFKEKHYLCEEEGCINEEFTAAFRTEIDLKAHKASKHKMSRKEARQARQLDWEFNYTNPRANHRDGKITGADYSETHGSFRGRGRGNRYHSNRENRDTERAIEASLQQDIAREQRPPKRRDKPRGERTEIVPQETVKPEERKQRPVKEDQFEKRRAAAAAADNRATGKTISESKLENAATKKNTTKSKLKNPVSETSDWSMGTKLTSCQFNESTWTNEGEKSPKVSKALKGVEKVEQKVMKEVSPTPKTNTPKEVEKPLNESDFPSLGTSAAPSAPGWSRIVPPSSEFPSLGSAAKANKLKPRQNGTSSVPPAKPNEPEFKIDFSKAIATNAMLHDKKKKASFKPPPQPPPSTNSYNEFPTLSSIANILSIEPQQAWVKNKQGPSTTKNAVKKTPITSSDAQATSQHSIKERSATDKNQSQKLNADKESKSKVVNGCSNNEKPKLEKFEKSENIKKPTAIDKIQDKSSKISTKELDVDCDSNRNTTPTGLPQASILSSKRQPPGFASPSNPTSNIPPGFSATADCKPPPPGFQTSSEFIELSNFKQRNLDLIDKIQSHLNYDPEGFSEFKRLSGHFRQGYLSADVYYNSCSELLGKDNFQSIFPDLVALLPDTNKQQELLLVNKDFKILAKDKGEKVLSIKKKGNGSSAWNVKNQNTTCNNCGQVILQKDLISHTNSCSLNTDFPSLGAASAAPRQTSTAWGRVK